MPEPTVSESTVKPNAKPQVVGIDLGTTFSAIAYVDHRGEPQTIPNSEGDLVTPSAALIENDEVTVGKQALKAQLTLPSQVATFAKRDIGKDAIARTVNGQQLKPEVVESLILQRLKRDAEKRLGVDVKQAVITVPAYFNEPKRRATMRAAELAGLETLAIINEPTSAAIAYGLSKQSEILGPQTVLVYDLGGGTFDVSLVHVDRTDIKVLATDGNAMLGGVDWDRCLVRWLDDQFATHCGVRLSETDSGVAFLMHEANELKHALSSRTEVKVLLTYQTATLKTKLTREQFEDLTAHLLDRTRFTVRKLIKESETEWSEVDQIVLVGGSTRLPQVVTMLTSLSGIEPNQMVSPDEAIAHGAALYADAISRRKIPTDRSHSPEPGLNISDVNAHDLGVLGIDVETQLRTNYVMIKRNTPIPTTLTARFETLRNNQRSVVVEVVEGGDRRGRYGTHLGRCVLGGLPQGLPAGTPVDVTFRYTHNGLMTIEARLPKTGHQASIVVERHSSVVSSDSIDDFDAEWTLLE
ncbi:Hsp70 family protein [Roseiconus lacunae]|uniref:Hsp70 family protein n=1 Tax=Roseiconus lacunae TaxID=2605694 RepID=A0ABT7PIL9_9BACT|nr:Hsp70 family protein [Roseiconus lacunae]MDM4016330.1 Hsp70 family protein [Roseiconus lacunae]